MEIVSTDSTYTFPVTGDRTLTAVFEEVPVYTITAAIDPTGSGTVVGTGQYREGETVTLKAVPKDGFRLKGWQESGQTVSESETYTFAATEDRALVGVFETKVSRLPAGYTEVEYVEMTSTATPIAYVSTGILNLLTHRYLLDVEFGEPSSASNLSYLGTDSGTGSNGTIYYDNYFTGTTLGVRYGYASSVTRYNAGTTKGRHTIDLDVYNGAIKFDGQLIASVKPPYATQKPVSLYAPRHCTIKWHTVEIYKENVIIAQMIPCKNSSGVAGFYDLIRNYFYTLTGTTGTITAGPSV